MYSVPGAIISLCTSCVCVGYSFLSCSHCAQAFGPSYQLLIFKYLVLLCNALLRKKDYCNPELILFSSKRFHYLLHIYAFYQWYHWLPSWGQRLFSVLDLKVIFLWPCFYMYLIYVAYVPCILHTMVGREDFLLFSNVYSYIWTDTYIVGIPNVECMGVLLIAWHNFVNKIGWPHMLRMQICPLQDLLYTYKVYLFFPLISIFAQ
jgi:hypothetical protein